MAGSGVVLARFVCLGRSGQLCWLEWLAVTYVRGLFQVPQGAAGAVCVALVG